MSNDLISREELLEALNKWDISKLYLLEDVKELVKEQPTAYDMDKIKEMEEEIQELRIITGLMQKRTYYRKFVDEVWEKQEGNELSSPDADYIYKLYFDLIEARDKVVEQLEEEQSTAIDEYERFIWGEAIEIVKGGGVDE